MLKRKHKIAIFKLVRSLIDPLFIKNKKKIVLYGSTGHFDANLVCIDKYLSYYHPEFDVVKIRGKQKRSVKDKLKTYIDIFSAYYLIVDHALPRFVTNNKRKIYNVWHGIPLKTIRHFDNKRFTENFLDFEAQNIDGLVCSSTLDMAVMSACFQVPRNRCILSGLPRNDLLAQEGLTWHTDEQENDLLDKLGNKKLVAWMPTYRGTWKEYNEIHAFDNNAEQKLLEFLQANDCIFGIRPHKFSQLQSFPLLEQHGLVIDLSEFRNTNTVLKHTEMLITDYSSVWLDFSIKSSKICLFLFDSEEYDDERGMIYPLSEVFNGDIAYNFDELISALERQTAIPTNKDKNSSSLFFKHKDNQNTKRFIDSIIKDNDH